MCKKEEKNLWADVMVVTNRRLSVRPFLEQVERICRHRPAGIILREKDLPEKEYEKLAAEVREICQSCQVLLVYHSFIRAARRSGIRAIHLPLAALEESPAGELAREFAVLGVSVHSREEACRAEALGATYLTAGHVYATDCKKGLPHRGTDFLREVCGAVHIPVFGIGGIRLEQTQIEEVKSCGAAGACVMSAAMEL